MGLRCYTRTENGWTHGREKRKKGVCEGWTREMVDSV